MDEKDPNEEELNPQGQDSINDADDSFGLPDLEYKPLDEDSDESDVDESDNSDETLKDAEENSEEEESQETTDEETTVEETDTFESEEHDDNKTELRYQMEEQSSNGPKIIGGIFTILLVAVAIWYFGFYGPQQKKIAEDEKARQEQLDLKTKADAAALQAKRAADAAAAAEEARLAAEAENLAKSGVQILEQRTGHYYIVLESFIDDDFAKDFGNKIAQQGTPTFLIPPYSKKKMQRVGIGSYESIEEAQSALNELPDKFGKGKWILKY